jgi:hypothetical protein
MYFADIIDAAGGFHGLLGSSLVFIHWTQSRAGVPAPDNQPNASSMIFNNAARVNGFSKSRIPPCNP